MTDYSQYTKVPISKITDPIGKDVVQLYHNYWWSVTDDNCVLFFRGKTPQCNMSKNICERITKQFHPECKVKQIPLAYVGWTG